MLLESVKVGLSSEFLVECCNLFPRLCYLVQGRRPLLAFEKFASSFETFKNRDELGVECLPD